MNDESIVEMWGTVEYLFFSPNESQADLETVGNTKENSVIPDLLTLYELAKI